ncbi:helix-turn-helix domain-containing protein [Massilia sp. P8910]|uniref:GlxA family transcriptional regulator n=1 Tax=Massilia antarctica TaxID=2765360 RepID=UPI001E420812|nr:helix-turn-helix domain-containing protein [Massilia antarctica]MCE3607483.1 helix-turn-helix domain-containing protein [Massilia antarctica]
MKTKRIAILAYSGCMGMEVFGLCDTLLLANRVAAAVDGAGPPVFDVIVTSLGGGNVTAAGGIPIGTRKPVARPDLLVVPGMELSGRDACTAPMSTLAPEIAYLAKAFARGTPVAAVCVGAFLLGEGGLLNGRRATTSWLFAPDLARRFPAAMVDPAAMLVEDGGVTTTGSFSATFDLAMHLVRQSASARVLRAVVRMGLLDDRRTSQAPFVDTRMLSQATDTFAAKVHAWLGQRLAEPYNLKQVAAAFHVSDRTLLRRVKQETGQTPLAYLQQARIGKAKVLLESTSLSVAQVTERVGYADAATFGALFKRNVGQSPAEYRRRFRMIGQVSMDKRPA